MNLFYPKYSSFYFSFYSFLLFSGKLFTLFPFPDPFDNTYSQKILKFIQSNLRNQCARSFLYFIVVNQRLAVHNFYISYYAKGMIVTIIKNPVFERGRIRCNRLFLWRGANLEEIMIAFKKCWLCGFDR